MCPSDPSWPTALTQSAGGPVSSPEVPTENSPGLSATGSIPAGVPPADRRRPTRPTCTPWQAQGQAGDHSGGDRLDHDLKRQGPTVSAIARRVGLDRKTVRRHLERGMEPPAY